MTATETGAEAAPAAAYATGLSASRRLKAILGGSAGNLVEWYDWFVYSAFAVYFMDHAPRDWLDIALHHDMARDKKYRDRLIEEGVFHFPTPTKQGSISFAHTEADIDETLEITERVVRGLA